jgi:hypothetical protein
MALHKQIEADRRIGPNAAGSGTPQYKSVVTLNSLRHGLRARTVVLPGENRDEFLRLCDDLEAEWQPQTRTEQFYLEQMAVSSWKLARMEMGEVDIFGQTLAAKDQVPLLDRLWQAQCRMERSHARAQRELERLQKLRRPRQFAESPPPPISEEIPAAAAQSVPAPQSARTAHGLVCAAAPADNPTGGQKVKIETDVEFTTQKGLDYNVAPHPQ